MRVVLATVTVVTMVVTVLAMVMLAMIVVVTVLTVVMLTMTVVVTVLTVVMLVLVVVLAVHYRRHIDGFIRRLLFNRLVHRGLETSEVDHEITVRDVGHLPGRQLEVVRFGTAGREIGDVDVLAADLVQNIFQGVKGRDSGHVGVVCGVGDASGQGCRRQHCSNACCRKADWGNSHSNKSARN